MIDVRGFSESSLMIYSQYLEFLQKNSMNKSSYGIWGILYGSKGFYGLHYGSYYERLLAAKIRNILKENIKKQAGAEKG